MADPWHGIPGGHDLHAWLIQSSYVRAQDDRPKKKKSRTKGSLPHNTSKTVRGPSAPALNDGSIISPSAAPGKKKTLRWMNERLLRDLAGPLDASAITDLYAPPPWGVQHSMTVLEQVTSMDPMLRKDSLVWESFENGADPSEEAPVKEGNGREVRQVSESMAAWRMVEKHAREALRRSVNWPMLREIEDKMLLLKQSCDGSKEELVLGLGSKYQRLLVHGLCQFHGLSSETLSQDSFIESDALMAISCRVKDGCKQLSTSGNLRLVEFLKNC